MERKIGIIGCGAVTEKLYLGALPNIKGVRISYLFDRDKERAQALARISNSEAVDLDVLRKESDIIIICTPPESHYELVKASLIKGKTVICEKPFMPLAQQAKELVQSAEELGVKLYVAHFRRIFPSVLLAKELIDTIHLGALKSISISEGGRFNWETVSDYYRSSPLGGVALDTGSHTIDMALFMSGLDQKNIEIVNVTAEKDKSEPSHEVNGYFQLKVDGEDVKMDVHFSRYKILANEIVFKYEFGNIVVPSSLGNFVKIEGKGKKSVIYSPKKLAFIPDAFLDQYKNLLYDLNSDIFSSERFYNLINILENLNKA